MKELNGKILRRLAKFNKNFPVQIFNVVFIMYTSALPKGGVLMQRNTLLFEAKKNENKFIFLLD